MLPKAAALVMALNTTARVSVDRSSPVLPARQGMNRPGFTGGHLV
jgi:hypothetical protein